MGDRVPEETGVGQWRCTGHRTLAETPVFRLSARSSVHPDRPESPHEFYVLEAPAWVNIVPLTPDHRVIMVRQYRHGLARTTLEIPGGMVDAEDADPAEAARRELLEETGYHASGLEPIGSIAPNPAIQSNLCHTYLATGLAYKGAPPLDGTEELQVVEVPLRDVPGLIRSGEICHALVVVAFCHLLGLGGRLETPLKSC